MMGKPNNVIDIKIARAIKEAGLKPTTEVMAEVLDRIGDVPIGKGPDKAPKGKKTIFFKDCPLVNKALGCRTASAIFRRLEYRFYIMPNGFYKFLAPCKNRYYRKGDSLLEEMPDVSLSTIKRAFKKIITAYKSKSLYEAARAELGEIGAFRGMPFLSYYNKNTHQTFYFRNKEVADLIAEGENPFKEKMFKDIKLSPYGTVSPQLKFKNELSQRGHFELSREVILNSPEVLEPAVCKASQPLQRIHTKNTSSSISPSEQNLGFDEKTQNEFRERETKKVNLEEQPLVQTDNASQMFGIWKKHTGAMNGLSPKKVVLEECLADQFNGSLDKWEDYCKMIAKSKLLMGEKGNFKAFLGWAIKPENIEDVLSGDKYDQDRSNSSNILLDREQIAEEERKEILSLDIPKNVRELRLSLLRIMGGATYRSWMKKCLIDEIGGVSVDFKPDGKFATEYVALHHKDSILRAVGDLFQDITIGGERLYVRK